jgi:hypothetical protein
MFWLVGWLAYAMPYCTRLQQSLNVVIFTNVNPTPREEIVMGWSY